MGTKFLGYLAVVLLLALVVLVLVSWLLSATQGDGVHSLLSAEGVRFFFGQFTAMLQQPLLVWLILLSMAGGSIVRSGLASCFVGRRFSSHLAEDAESVSVPVHRRRQALWATGVGLLIIIALVLLLTAMPHALLLSATGRLWPSPFSRALIPIIALTAIILSAVYGIITRHFLSLTQLFESLTWGIARSAPLIVLYVLAAQLYESARFVFF